MFNLFKKRKICPKCGKKKRAVGFQELDFSDYPESKIGHITSKERMCRECALLVEKGIKQTLHYGKN